MEKLIQVIKNDSLCDELLSSLDKKARDVDGYEYGLPIYCDSHKAVLREVIYKWILKLESPQNAPPTPETV